ncbi:MAG: hypothetical protein ACKVVP_22940 [Chloroflexota bacterium]
MTEHRVVGVRCAGDSRVTFAIVENDAMALGSSVRIDASGVTRSGVVVITSGQLIEFHGTLPSARANSATEADSRALVEIPGAGRRLLESLELPDGKMPRLRGS